MQLFSCTVRCLYLSHYSWLSEHSQHSWSYQGLIFLPLQETISSHFFLFNTKNCFHTLIHNLFCQIFLLLVTSLWPSWVFSYLLQLLGFALLTVNQPTTTGRNGSLCQETIWYYNSMWALRLIIVRHDDITLSYFIYLTLFDLILVIYCFYCHFIDPFDTVTEHPLHFTACFTLYLCTCDKKITLNNITQ